jgi:hypothetical protein
MISVAGLIAEPLLELMDTGEFAHIYLPVFSYVFFQ